MRGLTPLWAAALLACVSAAVGCHPSPEPETMVEAETLDVLRFESVVADWAEAESPPARTLRQLIASTPVQKRNDAVAIMAETFTSRPMVPLPGGSQAAETTQAVGEAIPAPVEKVTKPITDPLTRPEPKQNRVLLLEVVDLAGKYHQALLHSEGITPPPALKDVAAKAPLPEFQRIDPLIMSLMEDASAVDISEQSQAAQWPLVVLTYFDGGAWDAVAFRAPTARAQSARDAAPAQIAPFREVVAFALKHLPADAGSAVSALVR